MHSIALLLYILYHVLPIHECLDLHVTLQDTLCQEDIQSYKCMHTSSNSRTKDKSLGHQKSLFSNNTEY